MCTYPKLIHHNQSHAIAYSTALVGTKLACFAIMINCSRFLIVIWSKNEHTFFKTVIGLLVVKVDWVLRYILGVDFDFWSFNLVLINLKHKVFVTWFCKGQVMSVKFINTEKVTKITITHFGFNRLELLLQFEIPKDRFLST